MFSRLEMAHTKKFGVKNDEEIKGSRLSFVQNTSSHQRLFFFNRYNNKIESLLYRTIVTSEILLKVCNEYETFQKRLVILLKP